MVPGGTWFLDQVRWCLGWDLGIHTYMKCKSVLNVIKKRCWGLLGAHRVPLHFSGGWHSGDAGVLMLLGSAWSNGAAGVHTGGMMCRI